MKRQSTKQIVTKASDILTFGKFNGETISYVLDCEASYILWLDEKEIVEFAQEIVDLASHKSSEQHKLWLNENYEDTGENDDWGDRD